MKHVIVLMGLEPGLKALDPTCGYLEYLSYADVYHPFERMFYVRSVPYSAIVLQ
jgi:hypothetical protein